MQADDLAAQRDDAFQAALFRALMQVGGGFVSCVDRQRRILFLQGCVRDAAQARALEDAAQGVPELVMVVPALRIGDDPRVPYRRLQD